MPKIEQHAEEVEQAPGSHPAPSAPVSGERLIASGILPARPQEHGGVGSNALYLRHHMVRPGDTIGPYVVEAALTEGGMGVVYRARNRVTGGLRALKVVRPELAKDMEFVDRFVREATLASQVRHPNLVETLEPGIDGEVIFLPMELLEGETLHARLRRVQRLSWPDAVAVLVPVAEAVQLLHDRGIIHRDLKPANIFLAKVGDEEIPKVLDFGIARKVDDDEHTKTGMVIGSPYYMSLEQAEGRRDMDGRTDQYALSVIAYEMITGRRPYESDDTRSALAKLLRGEDYPPPSRIAPDVVSPEIDRAILSGLSRDRAGRFPSIRELARALSAASEKKVPAVTEEVRTVRYAAAETPQTLVEVVPARRSSPLRMLAVLAALAVLLMIGTGVVTWALKGDSDPEERAAPTLAAESAMVATQEPAEPERAAPEPAVERPLAPVNVEPAVPVNVEPVHIETPRAPPVVQRTVVQRPVAKRTVVERAVVTPRRVRREPPPPAQEPCGSRTGIPCD